MFDDLLLEKFSFIEELRISEFNYLKANIFYTELKKGEMIFGTHDRCESIPMVLKGALRLFRTSDEGREMTSYYITPGNICILAAICTMGAIEYDFSAQAEEDTLMAMIGPESFRHLTDTSVIFKNYVFNEMADKLLSAFSLIEEIKFTKVEERLLRYIKSNCDHDGELVITHERLAVNTGTVREVASRQLKKMESKGIVELQRGKIILLRH
ncbi:MAG: Crp/Fnr family transcriptional regulator [Clostridia bacterium]|jgi:CRP/FNR family transcriptional regulator|nr:Crp/Fnr family transcriptional regulator [Clostridia bacterium]